MKKLIVILMIVMVSAFVFAATEDPYGFEWESDSEEDEDKIDYNDPSTISADNFAEVDGGKLTTEALEESGISAEEIEAKATTQQAEAFLNANAPVPPSGGQLTAKQKALLGKIPQFQNVNFDSMVGVSGVSISGSNIQKGSSSVLVTSSIDDLSLNDDGDLVINDEIIVHSGTASVTSDGHTLLSSSGSQGPAYERGPSFSIKDGTGRGLGFRSDGQPIQIFDMDKGASPPEGAKNSVVYSKTYSSVEVTPGFNNDILVSQYKGSSIDNFNVGMIDDCSEVTYYELGDPEYGGIKAGALFTSGGVDIMGTPAYVNELRTTAYSDRMAEHDYSIADNQQHEVEKTFCRFTECEVDGKSFDISQGQKFSYPGIEGIMSQVKDDGTDKYVTISTELEDDAYWLQMSEKQDAGTVYENTESGTAVIEPVRRTAVPELVSKSIGRKKPSFFSLEAHTGFNHFSDEAKEVVWAYKAGTNEGGFYYKDQVVGGSEAMGDAEKIPVEYLKFEYD